MSNLELGISNRANMSYLELGISNRANMSYLELGISNRANLSNLEQELGIYNKTRKRAVQHKCLSHLVCINPTPLLF